MKTKLRFVIGVLLAVMFFSEGYMPVSAYSAKREYRCAYDGCKSGVFKKGDYCWYHAREVRKEKSEKERAEFEKENAEHPTICEVNGCNNTKASKSSYCSTHTCNKKGCYSMAVSNGYCYQHKKGR